MEITNKRKGWTLAAFVAGVSIPAAIIGHTVSNGLKATYVTEEHKELVVANAIESHSDHFHIDYNAHKDNTLVLSAEVSLNKYNGGGNVNDEIAPLFMDEDEYTGYERAGMEATFIAEVGYAAAVNAGLVIGAVYAAAADITANTAVSPIANDVALDTLGQVIVTGITPVDTDDPVDGTPDNWVIEYSELTAFGSASQVTVQFTFAPAEGYTFVRQNPDADNSHAGNELIDSIQVIF